MRIAFDVTSVAKQHPGGIGGYGRELVGAFRATAPNAHEYVVALRPNRWLRRRLVADLAPGGTVRLLVDGFTGPFLGHVDLLHAMGARLPRRSRFARVATIHDVNVFEYPELSESSWRQKRQARLRQTAARAHLVVALSEQGRAMLVRHLGLTERNTAVIPGGIDTDLFTPPTEAELARTRTAYGLADRPYFITLGRLGLRKNQLGFIDAFAHAGLDDAWRLVFSGPLEEEAARLRAHAAGAGLDPECIVCPGRVPSADLPALIAGSGGYVCSSMHEGQGRPVIEAQACGAPVASSNRGALPETLGDCGLLFDPTDRDDFADSLRRLATDTDTVADLRRRGPERARRCHAWPAVLCKLFAAYERALCLR